MNDTRMQFLSFCSAITGYTPLELESTGLVNQYRRLLEVTLATKLGAFYAFVISNAAALGDPDAMVRALDAAPLWWPVVSSLVGLWYLGNWTQLPNDWYAQTGLPLPGQDDAGRTHTPSSLAYIEQLSYRTADAHPPAAKATGFGTWGLQPVH